MTEQREQLVQVPISCAASKQERVTLKKSENGLLQNRRIKTSANRDVLIQSL